MVIDSPSVSIFRLISTCSLLFCDFKDLIFCCFSRQIVTKSVLSLKSKRPRFSLFFNGFFFARIAEVLNFLDRRLQALHLNLFADRKILLQSLDFTVELSSSGICNIKTNILFKLHTCNISI